jgi:transposase
VTVDQSDCFALLDALKSSDEIDLVRDAVRNSVCAELDRARISRLRQLDAEIKDLERRIGALVEASGQAWSASSGSACAAARILGEVGDVRRFPTASTFASVTGTAPIPASSARTGRHRLNRGGNRRLNRALYVVALTQTRHEARPSPTWNAIGTGRRPT